MRFKTGMKISKGDTLGVVWKSYRKIAEPHIGLSISHRGKASDPMAPFGLKTTFIPPKEVKIPEHFTAEQASEDLGVLFAAYEELYPSKYDIMTPEQDSLFQAEAFAKVADGIGYEKFYRLVETSTSSRYCHDSHLAVLTEAPANDNLIPTILIGALDDSLVVYGSVVGLEKYVGKRVISINGIPAEQYVERAMKNGYSYDAANESVRDVQNITRYTRIYGLENIDDIKSTSLVFSDGTGYLDKWLPMSKRKTRPIYAKDVAYLKNYYYSAYERDAKNIKFKFSQANDSTGVFTLTSFELSAVQIENIADSLKAMSDLPNMIIDVRNNPGGDIEALKQLLTYFINDTPVELHQYFRVNSNSTYPSLKYSQNYADDIKIFEGYEPREGKKGFYQVDSTLMNVMPDSLVNYKGKLYVLTGEDTYSAASIFASYLVRNRRAVTVGRETASGYHWLTAMKFADIVLPNSRIQVRIPLVKSIFDDAVTGRTPLGRGLMPDYEVPLTVEEYWSAPNDIVMEKALCLIAEGKYLSEVNPFAEIDAPAKEKRLPYLWIIAGVLVVALACVFVFRKKN